jgi:ActD protein
MKRALLIEFQGTRQLAQAALHFRERGLVDLDAYTPYSTEEVRDALGHRRSRLPVFVFVGALFGAGGAYALEWYTTAYQYPLNVGGRPPHMPLAYVPISFEMGVLAAATTAFLGVLVLGKLVKLWDPLFEIPGFDRATVDRFWLRINAAEEPLDPSRLEAELEHLKPLRFIVLEEP